VPVLPTPDADLLAERLAAIPSLARVSDAAGGLPVYLVGGAVRDLLLGLERTDLDIVVEGDATELARGLGGEELAGGRFATARATVDGVVLDLASARTESYAHPGALPDVQPGEIQADLARRDFTLNAMAIPLHRDPVLIDPHGGEEDLRAGLLRVLHAGSLVDDPTRALRAARYAARFGFELAPETERLVRGTDLATVSSDRVEAELMRLAAEPNARAGFELLDAWGLVSLPEGGGEAIDAVAALLESEPWQGVADRTLAVHAAATGRAPGAAAGLRDLRESARELAAASPQRPSEAVELARAHGGVELALARALGAEWADRYVAEWRHVRLEIGGDELRAAGIEQGPAIGRGLDRALRRKLDGEISGRDEELRTALAAARE
jgi:tRNA nucleotidyltransferase (CCA-adding enzyme)